MTGIEYLTPDGQQLTLDVTVCGVVVVCGGGGAFLPNFQTKFPVGLHFNTL